MQVKDVSDAQVLRLYTQDQPRPMVGDYLVDHLGIPYKVAERKIEQLEDRGYLAVGTSWHTAFLTDEGRAYMQTLDLVPGRDYTLAEIARLVFLWERR